MIVLNSLFPVFALLIAGNRLKYYGFTDDTFLKTSDRLIYFIFFPAMLFWKIGGASAAGIDWRFCGAAISAVLTIYVVSALFIRFGNVTDYQAGTFSQSCYRFNTYIGMAVILTAMGETGVTQFGILIGLVVPLINVLAVSTLIWYSGEQIDTGRRVRLTVQAILSNPLILACLAGILYARIADGFPPFMDNTLKLASMVALPLALLSIGSALSFGKLQGHLRLSLAAAGIKLLLFPLIGFLLMTLFRVDPIPFKVGMIFFALPTSTAIYVLSSQLNSDTELASAAIVLSTVASFFSLSVALML